MVVPIVSRPFLILLISHSPVSKSLYSFTIFLAVSTYCSPANVRTRPCCVRRNSGMSCWRSILIRHWLRYGCDTYSLADAREILFSSAIVTIYCNSFNVICCPSLDCHCPSNFQPCEINCNDNLHAPRTGHRHQQRQGIPSKPDGISCLFLFPISL